MPVPRRLGFSKFRARSQAVPIPLPKNLRAPDPRVLIVGASTRSAAHSACRAGLRPICIDAFGDVDLTAVADVIPLGGYPTGILEAAESVSDCPWMYTGALENHPQLVAALSERRLLWGNGAPEIAAARDPWRIQVLLQRHGFPHLKVWNEPTQPAEFLSGRLVTQPRRHTLGRTPPAHDGTWMLKPLRGSAGRGIVRWESDSENHPSLGEPHYFQEFSSGLPISALFLGLPDHALLLGVCRQLIGLSAAHALPMAWCGNIAPWPVSREVENTINAVGNLIGRSIELQGLFGCDFLLEQATPRLTEVNPRYTGSAELIEHLLQFPLIDWHRRACELFRSTPAAGDLIDNLQGEVLTAVKRFETDGKKNQNFAGKIILYANTAGTIGDMTRFAFPPASFRLPEIADIPRPGERFAPGQPVCTLFATSRTPDGCLARLESTARQFRIEVATACL